MQEAGVDEPDVVKTDGSLLVRVVDDSTLVVYDVTGAEPIEVGSLPLDGMFSPELLLVGDRVVVIGREPAAAPGRVAPGTRVLVVDVADPSAPTVVRESAYDSSLVTARQHGDVVRLVVSTGLPDLDFAQPGFFRREGTALEKNQGRRPVQHHRRLAAARHHDRRPTARNASSSSGATTSRSRPPTPGSARSRWSASTCTTRRPPTPPR